MKPCKKMSENGMPRFESLQKIPTENSRPEARGKKKTQVRGLTDALAKVSKVPRDL